MAAKDTVLITGGAGYIGSHVALQLWARGEKVVVLGNLVTGFCQAVLDAPLIVGNVGDGDLVKRTITEHGVGAVMHFAAHTIVPESVRDPLKYYGNNTCATRSLLAACNEAGVRQFVFFRVRPPCTACPPGAWRTKTARRRRSTATALRSSCRSGCCATSRR